MKKVLFMLAAVACAATMQAASVNWYVNKNAVKDYAGAVLGAGNTYTLLNLTGVSGDVGKAIFNDDATLNASYIIGTGTTGADAVSGTKTAPNVATSSSLTAGSSYNVALIFIDESTRDATGVYYTLSSLKSIDAYDETNAEAAAIAGKTSFASSAMAAYAKATVAPEPTSGLLLLIGGALIGLRRKRA